MKRIILLGGLVVSISGVFSFFRNKQIQKKECLENGTKSVSALHSLEEDLRMDIKYLAEEYPCVINQTCESKEKLDNEIQNVNREFQDSIGKISENKAMEQATNEVFNDIKNRNLQMTDLEISAAIFKRTNQILMENNGSSTSYSHGEVASKLVHLKGLKEAQENLDEYVKCLEWALVNESNRFDLNKMPSSKTIEENCGYRQLFFNLQEWETCQLEHDIVIQEVDKDVSSVNTTNKDSFISQTSKKKSPPECQHAYHEKSEKIGLLYETKTNLNDEPCGLQEDFCIFHRVTKLRGGIYYSTESYAGGSEKFEFFDTNLEEGWQYLRCELPDHLKGYFSTLTIEDLKGQTKTIEVSDEVCSIDLKTHTPTQNKDFISIDCYSEGYHDSHSITYKDGNITYQNVSGS